MRITPLIIILVLLLVALYYCSYSEGFETIQEKVDDRFNALAQLQNPITNPAVPIGISEADGATLRAMNTRALNVPTVTSVAGTYTLKPESEPVYPRIDNENSYLGLIKMCKEKGVGDNPFSDPKFAESCGMCLSSGSLKTGETFTKETGVLVYKEDKDAALTDQLSNSYPFPHVIPSVDAASCAGASRSSIAEPVLAITEDDYKAFKARAECRKTHGFKNGCAICVSNKESSWISSSGGFQPFTLWITGVGNVVVTLGGKIITDTVLSDKVMKVSLGNATEGTNLNITVSKGVALEIPYLYGVLSSITPANKVYKLPIEKFLETDKVSGTFVRKGAPMLLPDINAMASKLVPQPTKTSMSLDGSIPLTFVEPDQLAAYDCPASPFVSTQAGAELLITDPCLNPRGQGPGNYSVECRKAAILNAGCSTNGNWYKNPDSKNPGDSQTIAEYTEALKFEALKNSSDPWVSMGCFGVDRRTPCDIFINGGNPGKECIKYLYTNNSENSKRVGRAYNSSDTNFTSRTQKQFQFCQPTGSLNPEKPNGLNALLKISGGYDGLIGMEAIRKYLSNVFNKATNENLSINTPDSQGGRKDSWEKCIGLPIADLPPGKVTLNSTGKVLNTVTPSTEYDCGVVDHNGDDIKCIWGFDSYQGDVLKAQCDADPKCKAYNTIIVNGKHGGCLKTKSNPTNTNAIVKEFCAKKSEGTKCLFRASGKRCDFGMPCAPGSRCDYDGPGRGRCVTCDSSCNGQCNYVDGVYGRLAS